MVATYFHVPGAGTRFTPESVPNADFLTVTDRRIKSGFNNCAKLRHRIFGGIIAGVYPALHVLMAQMPKRLFEQGFFRLEMEYNNSLRNTGMFGYSRQGCLGKTEFVDAIDSSLDQLAFTEFALNGAIPARQIFLGYPGQHRLFRLVLWYY